MYVCICIYVYIHIYIHIYKRDLAKRHLAKRDPENAAGNNLQKSPVKIRRLPKRNLAKRHVHDIASRQKNNMVQIRGSCQKTSSKET